MLRHQTAATPRRRFLWVASRTSSINRRIRRISPTRNTPGAVDGTDYAGHVFDRMQDRGLTPSVIQNTIENGVPTPSRGGTTVFYDSVNNVSVVTNSEGKVITVKYGK